jgi:integrase
MQRGQIYQSHGAWFLRYREVHLEDGKRVAKRMCARLAPISEDFPNKRSVLLLAEKVLAPINSRQLQPESTQRLVDFIEKHYLPHADAALRPSTCKGYRDIFKDHLKTRLGDIRLRDFRTVHGQRLLTEIYAKDGIGHTSMSRIKSLLSGVLTFALREGLLDGVNVMRAVQIPGRPARTKQPIYELGEIDAMLRALPEPARTIVTVAAFTGLRVSELRGLQWGDYDGESIHVRRSVWRTKVGATKTRESEAAVPVLPFLRKVLDTHRTRSSNTAPNAYIFAGTKRGAPLNMANLARRVILPAIVKVTFDDGSSLAWKGWHAIRRGLASNLYGLGVQPKVIQAILRHSSISTTMEIYVQTDQTASREAMQKLEAMFSF